MTVKKQLKHLLNIKNNYEPRTKKFNDAFRNDNPHADDDGELRAFAGYSLQQVKFES